MSSPSSTRPPSHYGTPNAAEAAGPWGPDLMDQSTPLLGQSSPSSDRHGWFPYMVTFLAFLGGITAYHIVQTSFLQPTSPPLCPPIQPRPTVTFSQTTTATQTVTRPRLTTTMTHTRTTTTTQTVTHTVIPKPTCSIKPRWTNPIALPDCASFGARTYTARFAAMPDECDPIQFDCSNVPITIHGRTIEHPTSCYSELSQCQTYKYGQLRNATCTTTHGEWVVDEGRCIPTWDPVPSRAQNPAPDARCSSYNMRGYTAHMSISRVPPGLEPYQSCLNTSALINRRPVFPDECQLEKLPTGEEVYRARFMSNDTTCAPHWVDIQRDWRCEQYNLKHFWALMQEVEDLDGLEACSQIPHLFFDMEERFPDWCERDELTGKIRGHWMLNFNVPECHPVFRDVKDLGCIESKTRRVEARADHIEENDDWYRMCTTTPLGWDGVEYFPFQCEDRGGWGKYAMINIYNPHCR